MSTSIQNEWTLKQLRRLAREKAGVRLTHQEIASVAGLSVSAIEKIEQRALAKLRTRLSCNSCSAEAAS